MEKASGRVSGRSHVFAVPPSPRLVRSTSGSSPAAITTPERSSRKFSSSERFIHGHRSKSTSRSSRTYNDEDDSIRPRLMTSISSSPPTTIMSLEYNRKKSGRDGFRKLLKRGVSPDDAGASRGAMPTVMKAPSAWALSPGRTSLGSPIPVGGYESPAKANAGGGVTNKVLKYFKQRKVSTMQEEQYHRFRILHNRLLQWRFINARAEIAMASVKNVAEIQLFSVWFRTLMVRKIVIQKRFELQKIKHLIKLCQILNPQLSFANEWGKLKRRNHESIVRLMRKLSALSTTLPLTHNVKVDTQSVCEALNTAIVVMDNIESLITRFQAQAEKILYQVTELITASKQEEEYLHELMRIVPMITTLLEKEKCIQVHLIQTKMETKIGNHLCSIGQSST